MVRPKRAGNQGRRQSKKLEQDWPPLAHAGVVRELKRIGVAGAKTDPAFTGTETITLASGWKRENLRAVLFLQEKRSRRVIGAASIPLI